MLRLNLKSDSEVHHDPDGTRIILYVDRWKWLVPLISSFGGDVVIEEPRDLRDAMRDFLATALRGYDDQIPDRLPGSRTSYLNDDSRLRSTRGRPASLALPTPGH